MTYYKCWSVLNILCLFLFLTLQFRILATNMFGNTLLSQFEGRIVGGFPVSVKKFPHAVQIFNFGALCGGSILSSYTVLTAAHCFNNNKNINEMQVHTGARYTNDMSAEKYNIWYFDVHDDYGKEAPFACDIALIFVTRPIRFSEKVQKAVLVNSEEWMNEKEHNFTATGWGFLSYGGPVSNLGLMETHLHFVPSKKCSQQHSGVALTADMFCLYGDAERDTCQGDSGGGILWHGLIVGLVSHGFGCAERGRPGVYTNVYRFRFWIEKRMTQARKNFCILPPS